MCFPNNPKTFKSTFVSKTSQAITKVCTCIWSACGRPGASVGRSSTWTSCCTGRTGSRCRPSKRCLAQKNGINCVNWQVGHYCKRFLTKLFWEATQLDALGRLGFEDHQRMRWGKSPKATESEGWVWRSWVWIPKPARIFSSEIYVDNYSPTFFFCLPNFMWQIINLCKSVSTKLQIAHIKEIKKPNVSKKLRNHCITIQS